MKNHFKRKISGFTLIELLVVVLIIGILAAVAVPQYQKAVAKTRVMRALPILKAISEAKERYFMANGEYTADLSSLDINIPYTSAKEYGSRGYMAYAGTPIGILNLSSNAASVFWSGDDLGITIDWYGNNGACYSTSGEKGDKICSSVGTNTGRISNATGSEGAYIYKLIL